MIQDRSLITASFIIAFLLFTTGCISQPMEENQSVNTSQNNSLSPPTIVKDQSQCPLQENKMYSIVRGEPFYYSGGVPSSDIQFVQVLISGKFGANTPFNLTVNQDRTFTFSLSGNKTREMRSGIYHVLSYSQKSQERFDLILQNNTNEIINKGNLWIHIDDPVGDRYLTEPVLTFNGTTNLAVGEEVFVGLHGWELYPCPRITDPNNLGCGKGFQDTVKVEEGTYGINKWSVRVNSSIYGFWIGDLHFITVSSIHEDFIHENAWDYGLFRVYAGHP
jgi:hypothetical protein